MTRKAKSNRKRGRKANWTSKRQQQLREKSTSKIDDFRSVIRGTLTYAEYEKRHHNT